MTKSANRIPPESAIFSEKNKNAGHNQTEKRQLAAPAGHKNHRNMVESAMFSQQVHSRLLCQNKPVPNAAIRLKATSPV